VSRQKLWVPQHSPQCVRHCLECPEARWQGLAGGDTYCALRPGNGESVARSDPIPYWCPLDDYAPASETALTAGSGHERNRVGR
jgi:hypothetical protein